MRKCPDCEFSDLTSIKEMRLHRRTTHGFVTCTCGKDFLKIQYMDMHRNRSRKHKYEKGRFQCNVCSRRFQSMEGLQQHQKAKNHSEMTDLERSNMQASSILHCERTQMLTCAFGGLRVSAQTDDIYRQNAETLERFIAEEIQADSLFLGCCGEVINNLVRKLQDTESLPSKLRPRRIIKSGSLGKGTAVKNRADIDLVLMLAKYDDVEALLEDIGDLLKSLKLYLEVNTVAKHQRTTRYSVQVELTCRSGHKHDVDILPAVDLFGIGFSPDEVYRQMRGASSSDVHEYSVSLSPLQLDIITALPTKVKNLIKLIKYWKDKKLKEKDEPEMPSFAEKRHGKPNWPSSYALELVVMNAWTEANKPVSFDIIRALHAVLTSLVNHRQFKIILRGIMKYDQTWVQTRHAPYIMDPANPFNDMYHGLVDGKAFDWDMVVPEARHWLSQPLFNGVSNTERRWK